MGLRSSVILVPLLLASPAFAQDEGQTGGREIVITGTPLSKTKELLDACLARKCPPKEDIDASLAHAENQFVAGDYVASRATLAAARSRNNRYAETLPVEVADLNRAYGRLSDVSGYREMSRYLQIESLDSLKAGLDHGDSRVLMQRLSTGDEYAKSGRLIAAADVYRKVAKQAQKAGLPNVRGHAMLREAMLFGAASYWHPKYNEITERKIEAIEQTTDPALAAFRGGAKLLRARLAAERKDNKALDEAFAAYSGNKPTRPMLVYTPPIRFDQADIGTSFTSGLKATPEWIDVRFRVALDGTVTDVETINESASDKKIWPAKVLESLRARRYVPLAANADEDLLTRVERFTMVYDMVSPTGSRLRARSLRGRISSIDLTAEKTG